jgi:hypothetical protein
MVIKLVRNDISSDKQEELKAWVKSKQDQWIDCDIILD